MKSVKNRSREIDGTERNGIDLMSECVKRARIENCFYTNIAHTVYIKSVCAQSAKIYILKHQECFWNYKLEVRRKGEGRKERQTHVIV